mgnify:CR=1 FL=1|jgi:hypothetical protein
MSRRKDVVEIGDVYTNRELGLTYRVLEVRDEGDEKVVTVETLEEGVETYRTLDEIESMLEKGEVVESDVSLDEFENADEDAVPVESSLSDETKRYLKILGAVGIGLLLAGVLVPVAGVLLKAAARFLIPAGILGLGVYFLYRTLS